MLEETLKLLQKDPRSLTQIATAANVGYFWIRNLKNGTIKNPGIRQIERLHAALKKP